MRWFSFLILLLAPLMARADVQLTQIADLLRMSDYVAISAAESRADALDVAHDMLGRAPDGALLQQIDHLNDPARLLGVTRSAFETALPAAQRGDVLAFLASDIGQRVMEVELTARQAFSDPDIETMGTAAWKAAQGRADQAPLLAQIGALSEALDLVERNVAGGMNAQMQFFQGLADGGMEDMAQTDLLAEVWAQEPAIRAETEDWLGGYLFMAYGPLSAADLAAYVAFSESAAGQALNGALFEAFDVMYNEQSYTLGRIIALNMGTQEL